MRYKCPSVDAGRDERQRAENTTRFGRLWLRVATLVGYTTLELRAVLGFQITNTANSGLLMEVETSLMPYQPDQSRGWVVNQIADGSLRNWRIARVLRKMASDREAAGHSDIGVQNLLFSLAVSLRPRRVLEIGTHIGTGAVIIGHALKSNRFGKLITLEPAPHYYAIASKYVAAARVHDYVHIAPLFSYQEQCQDMLRGEAPFELIFIDGAHDYDAALNDIAFCATLLCDNGIMILHDVGGMSGSYDPTGRGGVRQALWDFCVDNPIFRSIFLEFPVWLNNTGTAIVTKQRLDPPIAARPVRLAPTAAAPLISK